MKLQNFLYKKIRIVLIVFFIIDNISLSKEELINVNDTKYIKKDKNNENRNDNTKDRDNETNLINSINIQIVNTTNIEKVGYLNSNISEKIHQNKNLELKDKTSLNQQFNITNKDKNIYNTLGKLRVDKREPSIRIMADNTLIHGDPVIFKPFNYHEFEASHHVFHQIPQNQYPMFRSGYLSYPYNPLHYYRSPYLSPTDRKVNDRRLGEKIEENYQIEYKIMEYLNNENLEIKNNSILNS